VLLLTVCAYFSRAILRLFLFMVEQRKLGVYLHKNNNYGLKDGRDDNDMPLPNFTSGRLAVT